MTATEPDVRDLLRQIREAIHGPQMLTGVQLRKRLGLCRTTFHTRRALGKIGPQPVTTLGHPKWHAAEVEAWMRTRDAAGELYDAARWPAVWASICSADNRTIEEHLADFQAFLKIKGSGEKHIAYTVVSLRKCFASIMATHISDLSTERLEEYLISLGDQTKYPAFGARKSLRSFFVWMVGGKRMTASPLSTKTNRAASDGKIYFIQGGEFVKIGFTIDPEKRIIELQTASPHKLEMLFYQAGNRNKEAELHGRFAKYRVRPDSEWFVLSPAIIDYITKETKGQQHEEPV